MIAITFSQSSFGEFVDTQKFDTNFGGFGRFAPRVRNIQTRTPTKASLNILEPLIPGRNLSKQMPNYSRKHRMFAFNLI